MRLIDADALYERLKADEELARNRVIDTPSSFPNGAVNPFAIRYMAQLNERTRFKEIVFDAPTIEERKSAYLIDPNPYGKCSNCGQLIDIRDEYNFCPSCGARMEDNT